MREIARRRLVRAQLDAAGLELDEMDIGIEMRAKKRLAMLIEERDHLEKALRIGAMRHGRRVERGLGRIGNLGLRREPGRRRPPRS